jgi:hypothetical protein
MLGYELHDVTVEASGCFQLIERAASLGTMSKR